MKANPSTTLRAKKSLGQHFLMHPRIAERMVQAAGVSSRDTVLEIGPGTGILTKPLLAHAKKVIAMETDGGLAARLRETFASEIAAGDLELIEGDIRDFDPTSIGGPYGIVANIPYYLSGEILRMFLSTLHKPRFMTLLMQKEVAERIACLPAGRRGKKKESILSVSVKAYGMPRYRFTVPRGAFVPAPRVDSAVISIDDIRSDTFVSPDEEKRFFDVVRAGFAHKRKKLAGNLAIAAGREAAERALQTAGVPRDARPEDVPFSLWRKIARALSKRGTG